MQRAAVINVQINNAVAAAVSARLFDFSVSRFLSDQIEIPLTGPAIKGVFH